MSGLVSVLQYLTSWSSIDLNGKTIKTSTELQVNTKTAHQITKDTICLLTCDISKNKPGNITINTHSFPTDWCNECSGIYLNTVDLFNLANMK